MKIVINTCSGGFSLSLAGIKRYLEIKGEEFGVYKENKYPQYVKYDNTSVEIIIMLGPQQDEREYNDMDYVSEYDLNDDRTDTILVQVVEEMGSDANGRCAVLKVVEIPDYVDWYISDDGGHETIIEKHRYWR